MAIQLPELTLPKAINDLHGNGHTNGNGSDHQPSTKPQELKDDIPVAAVDDGGPAVDPGHWTKPVFFEYEVVPGYFVQNGPKPKHINFSQILDRNFGLIDTSPARWHNLKKEIARLQGEADEGVIYKVFFLGRHGQGWHNHGASKHGVAAWEAKWTFLRGDGTLTWGPDPALTPLGESQAASILSTWQREELLGAPIHSSEMRWYVSPMQRACQTMFGSYGGFLPLKQGEGSRPEVWEDWREIYGSHTCDERSSKTVIRQRFPELIIEESLTEEDELWKPEERENNESMQTRGRRALDRVFGDELVKESFISITSHSEFFRNLLAVINHQPYPLSTGEMIPVVVKATRVKGAGERQNGNGDVRVGSSANGKCAIH